MIRIGRLLLFVGSMMLIAGLFPLRVSASELISREKFLADAFGKTPPAPALLWMNAGLKSLAHEVLGHPFNMLRVRYWKSGEKTAWILDEIGKEQPITIGVVIDAGELNDVRILAYRESRGWEVQEPFFTRQFNGLSLNADRTLSGTIDGITGATLSVRAVTRISRLALAFDHHVQGQLP